MLAAEQEGNAPSPSVQLSPRILMSPLPPKRIVTPFFLCLGLLLPFAAAPEARSEELHRRSVAVIHLAVQGSARMETKEAVATTRGIAKALSSKKSHPDLRIQDLHAKLNAGAEGTHLSNIANGRSFYEAGLKALESGMVEDAVEQLEGAMKLWERSYAYLARPRDFRNLLAMLGAAQLKAELGDIASATFARAALMGVKKRRLKLAPEAMTLLRAAQDEIVRRPNGKVEVITEPANAEVYLDGRFKGVSPLELENVLAGKHIVTLQKLGYQRLSRVVTVTGGEAVAEVLEDLAFARKKILLKQLFEKLPRDISQAESDPDSVGGASIRLIKNVLGCEVAVIVRVSPSADGQAIEALVFDTTSKKLLKKIRGVVRLRSNLRNRKGFRAFSKRLMDFDYAVALGGATDPGGPVIQEGGITSKWWFWTAIGTAVLGATAGTLAFVLNQEEPPPFTKDGTGALVLSF